MSLELRNEDVQLCHDFSFLVLRVGCTRLEIGGFHSVQHIQGVQAPGAPAQDVVHRRRIKRVDIVRVKPVVKREVAVLVPHLPARAAVDLRDRPSAKTESGPEMSFLWHIEPPYLHPEPQFHGRCVRRLDNDIADIVPGGRAGRSPALDPHRLHFAWFDVKALEEVEDRVGVPADVIHVVGRLLRLHESDRRHRHTRPTSSYPAVRSLQGAH